MKTCLFMFLAFLHNHHGHQLGGFITDLKEDMIVYSWAGKGAVTDYLIIGHKPLEDSNKWDKFGSCKENNKIYGMFRTTTSDSI